MTSRWINQVPSASSTSSSAQGGRRSQPTRPAEEPRWFVSRLIRRGGGQVPLGECRRRRRQNDALSHMQGESCKAQSWAVLGVVLIRASLPTTSWAVPLFRWRDVYSKTRRGFVAIGAPEGNVGPWCWFAAFGLAHWACPTRLPRIALPPATCSPNPALREIQGQ